MSDKKSLLPALITQMIYYAFSILSMFNFGSFGEGYSLGFVFWIMSIFVAFICIMFHVLGAVLNITRENKTVPIVYLILAIIALPLLFILGTAYSTVKFIIMNAYLLVLFIIPLFYFLKKNV